MDGTPNATLLLVIIVTIPKHSVSRILIDDGNLCNLMYLVLFMKLGLHKQDLRSSDGRRLLAFNDSSNRPCEELHLLVSFGEGE